MQGNKIRTAGIAIVVLVALATIPSLTSVAAKKKAPAPFTGSITMTAPAANAAVHGSSTHVAWSWKSGTLVKSTSLVNFQTTQDGTSWQTIGSRIPIRNGGYEWNTLSVSDSVYAARVMVDKTTISALMNPIFVDNTSPIVHITRPNKNNLIVEDQQPVDYAIVVGTARLEAIAVDGMSGVASVEWMVDQTKIGTGVAVTHNFSDDAPGFHDITVTAKDRAGNSATETTRVLSTPGPSASGVTPPNTDDVCAQLPANPNNVCPIQQPTPPSDVCPLPADPAGVCPVTPPTPPDVCSQLPADPAGVCPITTPNVPPDAPDPGVTPPDPNGPPPSQPDPCTLPNASSLPVCQ